MSMIKDVAKFHELAAPVAKFSRFQTRVNLPVNEGRAHLLALVTEEYTELTSAMVVDENVPDAADALLDVIYVCLGGLLAMGLTTAEVQELWDEVQRANMSKVDPAYGMLNGNEGVAYMDGWKITKPPGFVPPNVDGLIDRMRRSRG